MTWYILAAFGAVAALFLYFDFRSRGRSRTPAVDAFFGGCAVFVCAALWTWGAPLLVG